ncbi:hypothetical protein LCGC14_1011920 [marine sediment metagenome]|uniref:Uncharacterized protein n=1 Tax=marine sediment metagenome TaxID=412755 RepID=A0A0F9QIB2_9ZZZZ
MKENKKWKVNQTESFIKDLNEIPEEDREQVFDDLDKLFKGFKDGTIDPEKIGEPIDMEKLKEEEPELYEDLIKRSNNLK